MATALDKWADAEPSWDYPVIIESHINGVRSKEMNPNTPISYDEIAEDAIRCWEAGACAIHAHNTSFDLLENDAYKDYMRTWDKVLAKHPNITWYPTTCNNLRLLPEQSGLGHVPYLKSGANVKIASLLPSVGTISVSGSSVDPKRLAAHPEIAWRSSGRPTAAG